MTLSNVYIAILGPRWRSRYGDLLRNGWSGNRTSEGAKFPAPPSKAALGPSNPLFNGQLIPKIKRPGRGVRHPPLSSAEVKEREEL